MGRAAAEGLKAGGVLPVELRLEEPIPNTTQWKLFSKGNYTIKRSFTTDFDF